MFNKNCGDKIDENYSFIAYIDETGDIGLRQDKLGSSKWFGMSAFLIPANRDLELVSIRDCIVKKYKAKEILLPNEKPIHMKEIKKEDTKRFVAKEVGSIDFCKGIVVLSNKYSIYNSQDPNLYKDNEAYYRYMSRLLLERITDCCSDWRKNIKSGNGKVKIIFATRKHMSYDQLKQYLFSLKTSEKVNAKIEQQKLPKINWSIIDINNVDNIASEKRAGLQFADVLAFSFYKAVTKNKYDMVDTSFCKYLKNIMYKKEKRVWHNGVFVTHTDSIPKEEFPRELDKIFNYKNRKQQNQSNKPKKLFAKLCEVANIKKKK